MDALGIGMNRFKALLVIGLGLVAVDLASYLHEQKQRHSAQGKVETSDVGQAGRDSSDNRISVRPLDGKRSDEESKAVPDPPGSVDALVATARRSAGANPLPSEEQILSGVASSAARFLDKAQEGINAYKKELEKLDSSQQTMTNDQVPVTVINAALRRRIAPYLESMKADKHFVDAQNLPGCLGQQKLRLSGGMEAMIEGMNRASSLGLRSETVLGYSFSNRELRLELGVPSEATQNLSSGSQTIMDSLIGFKACKMR